MADEILYQDSVLPLRYVWSFLVNLSPVYFIQFIYVKEHLGRSGEGRRVHCHPVQVVVRVITTDNKILHIGNLLETRSQRIGHAVRDATC